MNPNRPVAHRTASSAVSCDELDPSLFEGAPHIFKRMRIWLSPNLAQAY